MTKKPEPLPITQDAGHSIPWPNAASHKHSRGRLAVVAGSPLQTGAARLAASAGQRIGAGWVCLFGEREACQIMAAHETSILICERDDNSTLSKQVADFKSVIIGPGFGLDSKQRDDVTEIIANFKEALVLDADALRHIASRKSDAFQALKARQAPSVLTPHSGEFIALFGAFNETDKVNATCDAARLSSSIVVHKGALTIIAGPDGDVFINSIAAPFLATAGTGDVLAGMIGGLLAQGMAGLDACKAAVWLHSVAGRNLGPGLIAEDLIGEIPSLLEVILPEHLKVFWP